MNENKFEFWAKTTQIESEWIISLGANCGRKGKN